MLKTVIVLAGVSYIVSDTQRDKGYREELWELRGWDPPCFGILFWWLQTAAVSRWEEHSGTCLILSCELCLGAACGGGGLVFFCFDQDRYTSAEVEWMR